MIDHSPMTTGEFGAAPTALPHDDIAQRTEAAWNRQTWIGLSLAATLIAVWFALHVWSVFFYQWGAHSWFTAPAILLVTCWLYVGLFIIAHDCMHGSLAPGWPSLNRRIGQLCLTVYAGFDYDLLNRKHHQHHRYAGTAQDPDYDARPPHGFWSWYAKFLIEYFSLRQVVFMTAVWALYLFVFQAQIANVLLFWGLPAFLSSVQLFLFGTYLPHRPGEDAFTDRHRTRSTAFGWWLSLLTCFHFGYHHEHHEHPELPWWRLPSARH